MKMSMGQRIFGIFNYTLFFVIALITLYPIWYVMIQSVMPQVDLAKQVIVLFPSKIELSAYINIFKDDTILNGLKISSFVTIIGTICSLLVTTMAAYSLSKKWLYGGKVMFQIAFFTMLFSGGMIPLYLVIVSLKLVNNIMLYVLITLVNTFYLLIMRTHFMNIPESLEDSAKIDGCNDVSILFRILIPISKPVLATIALFYAVDKWNILMEAKFFMTDQNKYTIQAILYGIVKGVSGDTLESIQDASTGMTDIQVKGASITVATLPILFIYPFLQKNFTKGVFLGSIKD